MIEFSNELTKAQEEMLILTMEECSELIKACSKILRHGLHAPNRSGESLNSDDLHEEASDVVACLGVLVKNGFLNSKDVNETAAFKLSLLKDPSTRRVHFITPEMIP